MLSNGDADGSPPLDDVEDAALAARAADGDTRAFTVLMRRVGPALRAYGLRLTDSAADVDDALQETFITAWERFDSLRDPAAVRGWLYRIMTTKLMSLLRARPRHSDIGDAAIDVADRGPTPEDRGEVSAGLAALSTRLSGLPAEQRRAWLLREAGGYSYEEIAEILEVSPSTVRGALARARRTLAAGMEEWR